MNEREICRKIFTENTVFKIKYAGRYYSFITNLYRGRMYVKYFHRTGQQKSMGHIFYSVDRDVFNMRYNKEWRIKSYGKLMPYKHALDKILDLYNSNINGIGSRIEVESSADEYLARTVGDIENNQYLQRIGAI